ncbi:MAG: DUF4097 family beta strand repeat protein [Chloroflexi bacterium]|nr:DUF4097 family beta strand repeat protein [Chloroflexota bacterium]
MLAAAWGLALASATALSARADVKEEFHQTYPLAEKGRIRLSNVNGSIHITAWNRAEVQVDAVKRAKNPEDLREVKIEVTSEKGLLRIETKHPSSRSGRWNFFGRSNSASVEYRLQVPRQAELAKISSVNGSLQIDGVAGPVRASTVNGSVKARDLADLVELNSVNGPLAAAFRKMNGEKSSSFKTVNGSITVALPGEAAANLEAHTLNGSIQNDFNLPVKNPFPIGHNLEAQIGTGGPLIKMDSVNGRVQIKRADTSQVLEEPDK